MIDGVGKSGPARIDLGRPVGAGAPAAKVGHPSQRGEAAGAGAAVADLVSAGPPVDGDKVAAIRAAIREGRYPVDPLKIAERMIEIDLPGRA